MDEGDSAEETPNAELRAALASGTEVQALTAQRELLTTRLLNAEPKETAALSRELGRVLVELRRLGASRQESKLDEIAERRERRRAAGPAAPGDPARAAGGGDVGAGGA